MNFFFVLFTRKKKNPLCTNEQEIEPGGSALPKEKKFRRHKIYLDEQTNKCGVDATLPKVEIRSDKSKMHIIFLTNAANKI